MGYNSIDDESYLGQERIFQASVNSREENSSPEMVMMACVVRKYGAWSHVLVVGYAHTYTG